MTRQARPRMGQAQAAEMGHQPSVLVTFLHSSSRFPPSSRHHLWGSPEREGLLQCAPVPLAPARALRWALQVAVPEYESTPSLFVPKSSDPLATCSFHTGVCRWCCKGLLGWLLRCAIWKGCAHSWQRLSAWSNFAQVPQGPLPTRLCPSALPPTCWAWV